MSLSPAASRVLLPAGCIAAAIAIGTWIVVDTPFNRPHLMMMDVALLAEAIAERDAALTYTNAPAQPVLWTTIEIQPSGAAAETWGGYDSIGISGTTASLDGTYIFAGRSNRIANLAADRGFIDLYTNTTSTTLLADLGPSGGGSGPGGAFSSRGNYRGGWVLRSGSIDWTLPRGFHLTSGRFLRAPIGLDSQPESVVLYAAGFDPSGVSVTFGSIASNRQTLWAPVTHRLATNEMIALPTFHEAWYTGTYPAPSAPVTAHWTTPSLTAPLLCMRPASPWIDGALASMLTMGSYLDHTLATTPPDDFDGYPSTVDAPRLATNATFAAAINGWNKWAFTIGTNAIYITPPFTNLGVAVMMARTHLVDAYWTNITQTTYISDLHYGESYEAALASAISSPGWTINATTNIPFAWAKSELRASGWNPGYIAYTRVGGPGPWNPASDFVQLAAGVGSGTLVAMAGLGHGTNGHSSIRAHYSASLASDVPAGETLIQAGRTGEWVSLLHATDATTADVPLGVVPTHIDPPDSSILAPLADGADFVGWTIDSILCCATPAFSVQLPLP